MFVNENIESFLKPKSKEEIGKMQDYILKVIVEMMKYFKKDDTTLFYLVNANKRMIKDNMLKNISAEETAKEIYNLNR
jgi:hypothetical protein